LFYQLPSKRIATNDVLVDSIYTELTTFLEKIGHFLRKWEKTWAGDRSDMKNLGGKLSARNVKALYQISAIRPHIFPPP